MARLHRINLKGPWNYEWLDGPHRRNTSSPGEDDSEFSEVLLNHSRVRMPSSIEDAWGAVTGTVRFRRRFQRPTNLDPHERVHIAFDGLGGSARVLLNEKQIAELRDVESTRSVDVTEQICPTNTLTVDLHWNPDESAQSAGGLWGAVAIEIHASPNAASQPTERQ